MVDSRRVGVVRARREKSIIVADGISSRERFYKPVVLQENNGGLLRLRNTLAISGAVSSDVVVVTGSPDRTRTSVA